MAKPALEQLIPNQAMASGRGENASNDRTFRHLRSITPLGFRRTADVRQPRTIAGEPSLTLPRPGEHYLTINHFAAIKAIGATTS